MRLHLIAVVLPALLLAACPSLFSDPEPMPEAGCGGGEAVCGDGCCPGGDYCLNNADGSAGCDSAFCCEAPVDYCLLAQTSCGDSRFACCSNMLCWGNTQTGYTCQGQVSTVCYSHQLRTTTLDSCCNTLGGKAGSGVVAAGCGYGTKPCEVDANCGLGMACDTTTDPNFPTCALVCSVAGLIPNEALPCCDGLVLSDTGLCGLPDGSECLLDSECASGNCEESRGGKCQ